MRVILLLLALLAVLIIASTTENNIECRVLLGSLIAWATVVLAVVSFHVRQELGADIQYIPAEYVAENETSTYFGTEDGNIFYVDRIPFINRNIPYLLGMDTKGTTDVTDDIILTVWALCE